MKDVKALEERVIPLENAVESLYKSYDHFNSEQKVIITIALLGMKQKLGIAQAIMEDQDIIVLDEPFNASDYKTYNDIKGVITHLKEQNHTMVLTSHNYQEVEELCDVVYLIDEGNLKLLTDELKEKYFSS